MKLNTQAQRLSRIRGNISNPAFFQYNRMGNILTALGWQF